MTKQPAVSPLIHSPLKKSTDEKTPVIQEVVASTSKSKLSLPKKPRRRVDDSSDSETSPPEVQTQSAPVQQVPKIQPVAPVILSLETHLKPLETSILELTKSVRSLEQNLLASATSANEGRHELQTQLNSSVMNQKFIETAMNQLPSVNMMSEAVNAAVQAAFRQLETSLKSHISDEIMKHGNNVQHWGGPVPYHSSQYQPTQSYYPPMPSMHPSQSSQTYLQHPIPSLTSPLGDPEQAFTSPLGKRSAKHPSSDQQRKKAKKKTLEEEEGEEHDDDEGTSEEKKKKKAMLLHTLMNLFE